MMIMRELIDGTKRFNELMRRIESISHKVLTEQLRELERDGFITRTVVKEVPPHVEYDLTELGWTIKPILDSMDDWGEWYRKELESEISDYLPKKSTE